MREAVVEGIGFWGSGLPDWDAACAWARGGVHPAQVPARPAPLLLAANERRRAPATVAVALEAALAACEAAGREAAALPSVFASTHGEMSISDYMCTTLASDPRAVSPTRFHNSVHNAAAGYWTIAAGAMEPATAISADFAMGLLEALAQRATGAGAVLLVGYDGQAPGLLRQVAQTEGLLGGALVLGPATAGRPRLRLVLVDGEAPAVAAPVAAGNAMAPLLVLFAAIARGDGVALLPAGPGRVLRVELDHG